MAILSRPSLGNPNESYEKLRKAAADARRPFDRDVWLNLAFYLDEQYVEWVDDTATLRAIPRPANARNAPRPVANKIMHFAQQEHSFVLANKPTIDVLPATDDPISTSDANVGKAFLTWLAGPQVAAFDDVLADAAIWMIVGGEGYLKWVWNPQEKRPDILSVSPLELYVDPYAKSFRKARYVIHSQFMDVEQVYDAWGKEIRPDKVEKADVERTSILRGMGSAPVLEGVTVNELWMRPCRRYPKGLYTVWAGKEQLHAPEDFPYQHGHIPFTQIGSIDRPGSQHYSSPVKYLRSAQMELNKYHAQRITLREAFANPKWWIDSALELEADPDDSPRQILRGNSHGGSLEPKLLQPTNFADNNEGSWITDEMMHIVGLHEVSQAQVPGRVEAAKAIEMLKEADSSRQATMTRTITFAISEGFWQCLMLARQYMPAEQIVVTYSRDGMPEVMKFKREQIHEGCVVRTTMQTGLASSRAAREDQILNWWQQGILRDPEQVADMLDLPLPSLTPDRAYDQRLARNENITLANNEAIVPNSWDNHEIHLRVHNNYRKSNDFLTASDEIKQKFEHHCQTHEQLQANELQKLVQKQVLMQQAAGAQAGGGQAPPSAGQPQQAAPAAEDPQQPPPS